jgi:hypothetical protein
LHLQSLDRGGDLSGHRNVVEIYEAPADHLRAVAQIEVLGERIALPATGALQTGPPPHARGPVEVEEAVAGIPPTLLE